MNNRVSISSLFHEIFSSNWVREDPEYAEELGKYKKSLEKLISIDQELTTFIRSQPVIDNDQLSSIPYIKEVKRTQILGKIEPNKRNGHSFDFFLYSKRTPLCSLFKCVTASCGLHKFTFDSQDSNIDLITAVFENPTESSINVECQWKFPLILLSSSLQKFMGTQFSTESEIALKIFSHIDSKSLNNGGEVKSDNILKSILGVDSFRIDSIGSLLKKVLEPISPLVFSLSFPSSQQMFSIHYPVMSNENMPQFSPVSVEFAPIKEILEEAVFSKDQILATDSFINDPYAFIENEALLFTKGIDIPELPNSYSMYLQPWIQDVSVDYLKSTTLKRK